MQQDYQRIKEEEAKTKADESDIQKNNKILEPVSNLIRKMTQQIMTSFIQILIS